MTTRTSGEWVSTTSGLWECRSWIAMKNHQGQWNLYNTLGELGTLSMDSEESFTFIGDFDTLSEAQNYVTGETP